MIKIKSVKNVKEIISKENWKIFGIGGLAITRSEMSYLVDDFELIYSIKSDDEKCVRDKVKATFFNIKKNPGTKKAELVLSDENVIKYIKDNSRKKKVGIYFLKSSRKLEDICQKNNWTLICNKEKLFKKIDSRLFFVDILKKINSDRKIKTLKIKNLKKELPNIFSQIGEKVVVQLIEEGGGRGTFFVNKNDDLDLFYDDVLERVKFFKGSIDDTIVISKFIQGKDFGIMGCIARNKILVSTPRYQIVDVPQLIESKDDAKGIFCGHDWSYSEKFPNKSAKKALFIVKKIGNEMAKLGYKGIFGVDFLINKKGEITPLEINPRLLGSFPFEIQIQLQAKEFPLLAFHLLEFLNIEYQIDPKIVSTKNKKKQGAHLIIFNFLDRDVVFSEKIKAGVYEIKNNKLIYLRKGFEIFDIKDPKHEFIITEGVPIKKFKKEKNRRLCRIIFKKRILGKNTKSLLKSEIKRVEIIKKHFKDKLKNE